MTGRHLLHDTPRTGSWINELNGHDLPRRCSHAVIKEGQALLGKFSCHLHPAVVQSIYPLANPIISDIEEDGVGDYRMLKRFGRTEKKRSKLRCEDAGYNYPFSIEVSRMCL